MSALLSKAEVGHAPQHVRKMPSTDTRSVTLLMEKRPGIAVCAGKRTTLAIFPAEPESASTGSGFALCSIQERYFLLGSSAGST
jgi:hypothetical protein